MGLTLSAAQAGGWAPFNHQRDGKALLGQLDLAFLGAYARENEGEGEGHEVCAMLHAGVHAMLLCSWPPAHVRRQGGWQGGRINLRC